MSTPGAMPVQGGTVIDGRYRVDEALGKGGMGVVLRGVQLGLNRTVAIKVMLPEALEDAESLQRFEREAKVLAKLSHPHIVQIIDSGTFNGCPYLVMEYLEGKDLAAVIEDRVVLPVGEAVSYLLQACDAVGTAHEQGIIHRDLKPANLFLTKGRGGIARVKVLDFGLAKPALSVAGASKSMQLTETGFSAMGTPLYMPPEQMGQFKHLDARSDIWSLGVILYHLITARYPFEAETIQLLNAAILRDPPTPPSAFLPDIPKALETVILRCLEKKPNERFPSVAALEEALQPFAAQPARSSSAPSPAMPSLSELPTMQYRPSQPLPVHDTSDHTTVKKAEPAYAQAVSAAPRSTIKMGVAAGAALIILVTAGIILNQTYSDTQAQAPSSQPSAAQSPQESAPPNSAEPSLPVPASGSVTALSSATAAPKATGPAPVPTSGKTKPSAAPTAVATTTPTGIKPVLGTKRDPND